MLVVDTAMMRRPTFSSHGKEGCSGNAGSQRCHVVATWYGWVSCNGGSVSELERLESLCVSVSILGLNHDTSRPSASSIQKTHAMRRDLQRYYYCGDLCAPQSLRSLS
ncbi:hypothetical protein E2C01_010941 [Portunus trituberculatus]|uniref:Uncharacterized protein n=1 Tax=Portunus trituberculatus TaxID=210409 RepID=A0A5B7DA38_PORTR|nr:hypothetical protein [Portunus trituberculatus]